MKVELKRLHISERLSQETTAFAADVWIDDKKAGIAENDGHGGATNVHIAEPQLRQKLEAYGMSVVPDEYKGLAARSTGFGVEWVIDQLVEAEAELRFEAKQKKRIAKFDAKEVSRYAALGLQCARFMVGDRLIWVGFKQGAAILDKMLAKYPTLKDWTVLS